MAGTPHRTWRVLDLPLGIGEPESVLRERACRRAGLDPGSVRGLRIARKSVDARGRRPRFVVHVDLVTEGEPAGPAFRAALRSGRVREAPEPGSLRAAAVDRERRGEHAVVVGAGPAGLYAALALGMNGVRVDLVDRGAGLERRGRDVVRFHRTRVPNAESNLLFGEGGAGTYSDGKLYTRIDDPLEVPCLDVLVECGAPPEILFDARAHIGTDRLHRILPRLRARLESLGVRPRFDTRLEGLVTDAGPPRRVRAVATTAGEIPCDAVFLALGHSARDTMRALATAGLEVEAKPFQLGVRIEHPQDLVDRGRYGSGPEAAALGRASYNLVCRVARSGRSAHSFCMCPGGRIVASVNLPGMLCTNGMSNSRHSSPWANAAIVTTLGAAEYGDGPFAGVEFQEALERRFFEAGGGDYTAPAQTATDFLAGRETPRPRHSSYTFGTVPGRIDGLLPAVAREAIASALEAFDRAIPGFAGPEGLLVGLESRSSGPVRMTRDRASRLALGFANLYPVGEGAGYAGGIMSAAIDGARSALTWLGQPGTRSLAPSLGEI